MSGESLINQFKRAYCKALQVKVDDINRETCSPFVNSSVVRETFEGDNIRLQIPQLQKLHNFDLSKYDLKNKRQILRNCVLPELGLHVFNCGVGRVTQQLPLISVSPKER